MTTFKSKARRHEKLAMEAHVHQNKYDFVISSCLGDDSDAEESKLNLYLTSEIRNCLDLFNTPMALKTCKD